MKRSKSKKVDNRLILFPSEKGWDLWAMEGEGAAAQATLVENLEKPNETDFGARSIFALPVRQVFVIPLWLATEDNSLIAEMAFLQLERRGLMSRTREETVMDYHFIKRENGRTLVLAAVLPSVLPEELFNDSAEHYELSARLMPLGPDTLTLWREDERLVAAYTCADILAYCHTLSEIEVNEDAVRELLSISLELQTETVIGKVEEIVCWGKFSLNELALLKDSMGIPARVQLRPQPCVPKTLFSLKPVAVRETQMATAKAAATRRILTSVVSAYAGGIAIWILILAGFYVQAFLQRREIAQTAGLVKTLKETSERWRALETAIQPDFYPIEVLWHCANTLPEEGVRLTLFEKQPEKVLMQGEAASASAAFKYLDDLKTNMLLSSYGWEMPQPKLLPNDTAQFQLEGRLPGAATE